MRKLLLSIFAVCTSLTAMAQKPAYDPAKGTLLDGRSIIKVSPAALAIKTQSFSFERILSKRWSLQLSYTNRSGGALGQIHPELDKDFANVQMGYTTIMPELRLYFLGGGYGRGLYLAPYARFEKANLSNLDLEYKATVNNDIAADGKLKVSGDLSSVNVGMGLGLQFYIARCLVFDFSVGVHYATSSTINLQGVLDNNARAITEDEFNKLKNDALKNVNDLPGSKVALEVEAIKSGNDIRGAKLKASGQYLFPRADLSIGFRF